MLSAGRRSLLVGDNIFPTLMLSLCASLTAAALMTDDVSAIE